MGDPPRLQLQSRWLASDIPDGEEQDARPVPEASSSPLQRAAGTERHPAVDPEAITPPQPEERPRPSPLERPSAGGFSLHGHDHPGHLAHALEPLPTRAHLPLRDPHVHGHANTDASMGINTVVGMGLDAVREALPSWLTNNLAYRAAEVAADFGLVWGTATYFHEAGHYRVGDRENWDPEIEFWWTGGMAHYNWHRTGAEPTAAALADAASAGINTAESTGRAYYTRLSLGTPSHHDYVAYIMNNLQGSAYMAMTLTRDPLGWDDNQAYVRHMQAQGIDVPSVEQMFAASLATDLLSADTWYGLYQVGRYIATGERSGEPLTWNAGVVEGTFPHLTYYRTADAQWIDGRMFLWPRQHGALELTGAASMDGQQWRAGLVAHRLPLIDHRAELTLGAALNRRIGVDGEHRWGYSVDAQLNANLTSFAGVSGRLSYSAGDVLHNDVLGEPSGLNAYASLFLQF